MIGLEWRPAARDDLWAIIDYISAENPDAALALLNEIEAKVAGLRQNPKLYKPGRVKGTRELVVRPNYIVVYAVEDSPYPSCACYTPPGCGPEQRVGRASAHHLAAGLMGPAP